MTAASSTMNDRRVSLACADLLADPPLDLGKHQRFQGAALRRVGEDYCAQPAAIDLAVIIQHLRAPAADDLLA